MKKSPHLTPRKEAERAAEAQRLARAMRENLRRRKEQKRAQNLAPQENAGEKPERED